MFRPCSRGGASLIILLCGTNDKPDFIRLPPGRHRSFQVSMRVSPFDSCAYSVVLSTIMQILSELSSPAMASSASFFSWSSSHGRHASCRTVLGRLGLFAKLASSAGSTPEQMLSTVKRCLI